MKGGVYRMLTGDEGLPEGIYPVQPVHDNQEYRPAGSRIHGHAARAETFFKQ